MPEDMENVVRLPDRAARSWGHVAEGLSTVLIEAGWPPAAVAEVVEELRPEYTAAYEGPTLALGSDPEDAVQRVNDWITTFLLRLLKIAADAKLGARL